MHTETMRIFFPYPGINGPQDDYAGVLGISGGLPLIADYPEATHEHPYLMTHGIYDEVLDMRVPNQESRNYKPWTLKLIGANIIKPIAWTQ